MREENYFEKKLETSQDTLRYTISELESVDIQIKKLTRQYEYDLDLYNKRAIRLQEIKVDTEKRIDSLKKKLSDGYTCIDIRTGKAYKSFDERHKADLIQKAKDAEERYKEQKKAYEQKKRRKEIPKPIVEAPIGEEVVSQTEREIQLLKEKYEELQAQKRELEQIKKKEAVNIIEKKVEDARKIAEVAADKIEKARLAIHDIPIEWINEYEDETGKKAIWKGQITNGFRDFLTSNGYEIGE